MGSDIQNLHQPLPGYVVAPAVQAGQEIRHGQLHRGDPGQQLPGAETSVPDLDRPGRRSTKVCSVNHGVTGPTWHGLPRSGFLWLRWEAEGAAGVVIW